MQQNSNFGVVPPESSSSDNDKSKKSNREGALSGRKPRSNETFGPSDKR